MKELIIKDLQIIANRLEKTPTRIEYFEITTLKITRSTILKYFDSYTHAIEQAGLNKKPILVHCNTCNKEITRTESTISKHNFCNHSCSAKFTNTLRKDKQYCKFCNKELSVRSKIYCNNYCQSEYQYHQYVSDWKSGNILRICRKN